MCRPHKHAALIKAWADGAQVEYFSPTYEAWVDTSDPRWDESTDYRIKVVPKPPIVRWLWAKASKDNHYAVTTSHMYSEAELWQSGSKDWVKLEWSRTEFPQE